jgi:hypothetical protein
MFISYRVVRNNRIIFKRTINVGLDTGITDINLVRYGTET